MPPRYDEERRALDLSVADLLERRLTRSLGFANRGGYERLWLGQAIHSRYQEEALASDGSYRREVWVKHQLEHRGWQVTITGRLDGVRKEADGTRVVEEIKSIRRGGSLSPALREIYNAQAQLYAWLLGAGEPAVENAPGAIRAELVLIEIGGEDALREEVEVDLRGVEALVRRRLNALLGAFEKSRDAALARREAGARLTFPYAEPRPGQEEIVAAVSTALEQGEHLLLEATTGIGKTIAALYPALRYCLEHDKRLYVLTAKTLQQEMAKEVLTLLNSERVFHSLRLRAKAKMCANGQVLCHEEYCAYAKDYALKLHQSGIVHRLEEDFAHLEPDAIFAAAQGVEVCPFEVSLELSREVQAVVCDYNYAFDPYVALSEFGAESDLSDVVLVIDEVHNLVDRGRGYYSPELSAQAAWRAAEVAAHAGELIHFRIERTCRRVAELVERSVTSALEDGPAGDRAVETELPEDELWRLRRELDGLFIDYLEYQRDTRTFRPDDEFVALYFAYLRFLNGLVASDGAFSHLAERVGRDARLKILCKDPSRFLGALLDRTHTTIGLSATLSPPEFYRDLLGFDRERTTAISVPNPFPRQNRRVVIDASVTTTFKERTAYYPLIATRLAELAARVPGNCLALFPSYDFLAQVAAHLEAGGKRVLIQRRAAGDREREEILQILRDAWLGDVLLLAVAGGVFAEGVDYPGDMLRAVAVVGPCLPGLSLEQELLKDYYQERFERGFEYAFVVPGMTRVVQAAGRLIRSPHDTGVIALLDRRFLYEPYRRHLPQDWLADGDAETLSADPGQAAAEFFRGR